MEENPRMQEIVADAERARLACEIVGRGHYMASARSLFWNRALGIVATILAAAVGTSIFSTLERQPAMGWKIAAGILSLFAGTLSSVQTSLKLEQRADNHRTAGAKYRALARDLELFIRKIAKLPDGPESLQPALQELQGFNARRTELALEAPGLPDRIWAAAAREIKREGWGLGRLAVQRVKDALRWTIDHFGRVLAAGVAIVVLAALLLLLRIDLASVAHSLAEAYQADDSRTAAVRRSLAPEESRAPAPGAAVGATSPTSDVERRFELVRHRPPLLRAFLQRMPKGGDLHSHLSGAVYAERYIAWAAADGICIDVATVTFVKPPCTTAAPPASTAQADPALYARIVDAMSLRNFVPGAKSGHDQFFDAFAKFGPAGNGHAGDMLAEVAARAASQHVTYVEVMQTLQSGALRALLANLSPDDIPATLRDQESGAVPSSDDLTRLRAVLLDHGLNHLVEQAHRELDDKETAKTQRLGCATSAPDPGCRVTIRYLQQVKRTDDPGAVFAQMVLAFALTAGEPRVVGLNLVSPEDYRVALRDYTRHMAMLDFLWRAAPRTNIALHAGELTLGLVPPDDLRDHIRLAIERGHAKRVGHAVSLGYEDDAFGLLRELARRQIDIEINLSSNDLILGVAGQAHPFVDYLHAGVPVTISTDDEGVARSDLTNEYQRATEAYDLRYAELKTIARNSLAFSFLPGATLWQSTRPFRVVADCAADEPGSQSPSDACARFLRDSERAREEWRLEHEFAIFERLDWRID